MKIDSKFSPDATAVVFHGDCLELLATIPSGAIRLVVTSPPYNIGKSYEARTSLKRYLDWQRRVVREAARCLRDGGSLCWQVGNFVENGEIVPLDIVMFPLFAELGLKLRNRVIWRFEHGLHCSKRLSGRYETVLWFTKGADYVFNLDPIRVPQKYPGKKYFRGPKAGQFSCNPLGKNPGDVWDIPNVKSNHVEKTAHPCQFPVELVDRLVLSLTTPGDWVLDPFLGAGTSIVSALRHGRRGVGAETQAEYCTIARARIRQTVAGTLEVREMNTPIFDPKNAGRKLTTAPWLSAVPGHPALANRELALQFA
ncbi:MAG: site-specific DNA-methyltransferase [Opitutaceae bacterium]|jgi:adenine-specific DNA-methyltransferase|nr:site-specific DNA-methyltransferase [Opitutaceae bacterium]